jgi:hypothetical protein
MTRERAADARLNQIRHAARDTSFQDDGLARFGGAQNFRAADSGEAQGFERNNSWIALRNSAGKLSGGLDEENARQKRVARKVAAQERFVAAQSVFARAGFSGVQRSQAIDETKLGAVRQVLKSGGERVHGHLKMKRLKPLKIQPARAHPGEAAC